MSQPLLSPGPEYLEEPTSEAEVDRIQDLEVRIGELEDSIPKIKRDVVIMVLNLLGESLRHIASGKMDISEVPQSPSSPSNGKWDAIKQRLQPRLREAVDVFLLRGAMNNGQLAAALRIGRSNCSNNVLGELKRQGLLVKNGNEYSLKSL